MKTYLIIILSFVFSHFVQAQEISLNDINSKNILDFYRQEAAKQQQEMKSVDISVQIGNGNTIEVYDKTPNYIEITQTGNYNTTYFVNPNDYPTKASVNISGSGNYIDITGSNSISDGMKMNIRANDMTIFMRNY